MVLQSLHVFCSLQNLHSVKKIASGAAEKCKKLGGGGYIVVVHAASFMCKHLSYQSIYFGRRGWGGVGCSEKAGN
jgi:hypothetical protein